MNYWMIDLINFLLMLFVMLHTLERYNYYQYHCVEINSHTCALLINIAYSFKLVVFAFPKSILL